MDLLTERARKFVLEAGADIVGVASAQGLSQAPEGHRPIDILEGARSVVVFGRQIQRGIMTTTSYAPQIISRSYITAYAFLDELSARLANFLEDEGYYSVATPCFLPLQLGPGGPPGWGLLSLKHAAVEGGLGVFAKNGLMINPKYGTRLRLGAVVTRAKLEPSPKLVGKICAEGCKLCFEACTAGAFDDEGVFQKVVCRRRCIQHASSPLAQDPSLAGKLELYVNTMLYNYQVECFECLKVCPKNR